MEAALLLLIGSLSTLLLVGVQRWATVVGLVASVAALIAVLSWVAAARKAERAADRYAVEELGVPIKEAWSHPFLFGRDTFRPWWASPSTAWHLRYIDGNERPST
ncbi:hypothetical protein ACQPXM_06455 [Kribbella sp. CA-253562]|uniref:hypothetical protein n=1 Tax=Kribbella sp. CA-253562 TaxID=3239942 RepID=UPI003D945F42